MPGDVIHRFRTVQLPKGLFSSMNDSGIQLEQKIVVTCSDLKRPFGVDRGAQQLHIHQIGVKGAIYATVIST